jgi:hypothetical protein
MTMINENQLNNLIDTSVKPFDFNTNTNNINNNNNNNKSNGKREKIKKIIVDILSMSTAHGIPNILRSNNLFLIIMWSMVCGLSVCVGSYFVIDNVLDYLKYNTVSTISVVSEQSVQFPTISICAHPGITRTLNETVLRVRYDRVFETNVEKYFEEFQDPVFGKCFRFNSGRNFYGEKIDILNSTSSGRPNGLRIEAFVDMPEQYDFVEIIVYIHNHSTPPYNIDYGG